ncbi:phage portal protein [Shouchella hunanensis]|uniref:Phage portal protein n=1 Tax=Shouchella hunanensis TaxID=766894 RepID=A0ABY7W1Y9_9BACI|nr:phage portal protein [Shouchella hunanensis]WDF02947.1 phage portal protein [Shouchella hunanensis]
MFRKVKGWLKGVMMRMGLVKSVKSISNVRSLQMDDAHYKHIDTWLALYKGYLSEWHDLRYTTVSGGKKRRMATLGMPKVVSQEMASLIFNERCEINVSDPDLKENIASILKKNKFTKRFQDYLEYSFALGGVVIKPYHDGKQIKLSYVTADCFVPVSWDNQGISEGCFVNESKKGDKKFTHLEWHLWENGVYVVKNELYESKDNELGKPVPLSLLYPNLEEETKIENFTRSNFVYIKPSIANNIDLHSPLGISIYANALDTIKSLDIAFDSYQREFKLGKKRVIVPTSAIRTVVDEHGNMVRYFDADDEVYEALNLGQDSDEIKDITISLRVEEHVMAINSLLNLLAMQTGFSSGSFSFDGQSVKTATEVVSENSKTFKTKQSHENVIEAALTELVDCIVQTAELYETFSAPTGEWEVTVSFDDSIAEDKLGEINKQTLMLSSGIQSKKRAIMKVHGLSEEEAIQWLQEIAEENKIQTDDAVDFFGLNDDAGA